MTTVFTIYDTDDQKTLMREVCRKVDIDTKVFKERSLLSTISSAKNEMILPDEFELNAGRGFRQTEDRKGLSGVRGAAQVKQCFRF